MKIFVVSQNLLKSGLPFPEHVILRINLAWHKDLDSVRSMLEGYKNREMFLDIPIGRKKPPNHDHNIEHIAEIANSYSNVEYVAISNVEEASTVHYYGKIFKAKIVPKIESYAGVMRSGDIIDALGYKPGVIMLDHEDLFTNLVALKKEGHYLEVVDSLIDSCKEKHACLLRVQGIIFSNVG